MKWILFFQSSLILSSSFKFQQRFFFLRCFFLVRVRVRVSERSHLNNKKKKNCRFFSDLARLNHLQMNESSETRRMKIKNRFESLQRSTSHPPFRRLNLFLLRRYLYIEITHHTNDMDTQSGLRGRE
jgi:hypothetical protein